MAVNNITHHTEERSIGLTAGIDCMTFHYFLISARYMHGLNHMLGFAF
ncbi:MAG: hypothetical protein ABIQ07_11135 [Ginsengibacter sp.]